MALTQLLKKAVKKNKILLSCEHGGNVIPAVYQHLFNYSAAQKILKSHRAYDPGALQTANYLKKVFGLPLFYSTYSRLLIELNRSLHHPALFSEFTSGLSADSKQQIIGQYYQPHRQKIISWIKKNSSKSQVVHLAIHSFVPRLSGQDRNCLIGLLYDPLRPAEKQIAQKMSVLLRQKVLLSQFNLPRTITHLVRKNYPYKGASDGLTTNLRKLYDDQSYAGIEIEINQIVMNERPKELQLTLQVLQEVLREVLY